MSRIKFTTWEKFQLAYIERKMGKRLSVGEKCAIVVSQGWRKQQ